VLLSPLEKGDFINFVPLPFPTALFLPTPTVMRDPIILPHPLFSFIPFLLDGSEPAPSTPCNGSGTPLRLLAMKEDT